MPWNPTLYAILKVIAKGVRRHFKVKESISPEFKEQLKNGPMIIVCNHASNLDFAYFLALYHKSMTGEDILIDNGEKLKSNFIWLVNA